MLRTIWVGIAVPLLFSTLAGCARQRCYCPQRCSRAGSAADVEATLPMIERGTISPDLSALGSYESVDLMLGGHTTPLQYRALDAEQCQCRAAANSSLGNLYDSESRMGSSATRRRSKCKAAAVQRDTWAFRAADERNKSAARALELFYSLAEAEANRDAIERSLQETDRAINNLEQLKAKGIQIAADEGALRRQRTDTLDRRDQLHLLIARLNGELRQLLGFDAFNAQTEASLTTPYQNDPTPIWPLADLKVIAVPVDVEAAVREGLAMRPDIGLLSMMYNSLDNDTLPAVRAGMSQTAGLLSAPPTPRRRSSRSAGSGELQSRRRQLYELLVDSEQAAAAEIRLAAHTVETRLRQTALARATLESWRLRLDQLLQRRAVGEATPFDLSAARLAVINAESELIHQVVAWEIARVKLKEAQGLLAYECGY